MPKQSKKHPAERFCDRMIDKYPDAKRLESVLSGYRQTDEAIAAL